MRPVILSEYNPNWLNWFIQLKSYLTKILFGLMIEIEHVGSTAVPKMVAKPIIDMNVVIERPNFNKIKENLENIGYAHQGDLGITGREAFDLINKELKKKLPPHNLYVCDKDNLELKRQLTFRDFLCKHPEYIEQYSKLKNRLVKDHNGNRKFYIEGKAALIQQILNKALKELDR